MTDSYLEVIPVPTSGIRFRGRPMVSLTSRVGTKGQIVIPKPVRDELHIRPGDTVKVSAHDGHAHVEKLVAKDPRQAWQELFDLVPDKEYYPRGHDWDTEYEASYLEDLAPGPAEIARGKTGKTGPKRPRKQGPGAEATPQPTGLPRGRRARGHSP